MKFDLYMGLNHTSRFPWKWWAR